MDPISLAALQGAAGAKKASTYVDDVFSTFLYEGNASGQGSSAQTITNNINLSGEGGLVWIKNRENTSGSTAWSNYLFDTERGATNYIKSNDNSLQATSNNSLSAFNTNGFTIGETSGTNNNNEQYCSWTFRKAPGFFDIVTWNGDGNGDRYLNHSLASVPGCVMVKKTSGGSDMNWGVYHREMGTSMRDSLTLNETTVWQNSAQLNPIRSTPTSTQIYIRGGSNEYNDDGSTYVAYLFAHEEAVFGENEDQSIIKCGSYPGNNSSQKIDVGFEPQFVLFKGRNSSEDWFILDWMRGAAENSSNQPFLKPNMHTVEGASYRGFMHSNGFGWDNESGNAINASGVDYIYIAIRRPFKPPVAGTDVFHAYYGTPSANTVPTPGFPFDMQVTKEASNVSNPRLLTRNLGLNTMETHGNMTKSLQPAGTDEAQIGSLSKNVKNTKFEMPSAYPGNLMIMHSFKRAPGFMDIVNYSGTGSAQTLPHNLGVVPEMMWVKRWESSGNRWQIYAATEGNTKYSPGFKTDPFYTSSGRWNDTSPTSTQFTVGGDNDVNGNTYRYVNFLFATLPGISKVGSYSGTGNAINVDCGFDSGARFVMIKRTDTEIQNTAPNRTEWYVWDYARGIVASGNDPWMVYSSTAAQVTNSDYIDPLNAGFTVNASSGTGINVNGGTYLYLAIA